MKYPMYHNLENPTKGDSLEEDWQDSGEQTRQVLEGRHLAEYSARQVAQGAVCQGLRPTTVAAQ